MGCGVVSNKQASVKIENEELSVFFLCLFQQKFIGGSKNIGLDLFPDAMAAILDFLESPPWVISPKSFIVCPDLPIYDCF